MEVIKSKERQSVEIEERLAKKMRASHHWYTHLFVWWIASIAAVACASTVIGILFMYIVFFAVRDGLYALIESKQT